MAEIQVSDAPVHQALNAINRISLEKNKALKLAILEEIKDNDVARWLFSIDCPTNRRLGFRVADEGSRIYVGTATAKEMEARFNTFKSIVDAVLKGEIGKAEARTRTESILAECSFTDNFQEGVWYTRLINHGLRLNLPAKAIASCWPELQITTTMPYAKSLIDSEGNLNLRKLAQVSYPCVAEPIIGGVIASIVITDTDAYVTAFGGRRIPAVQEWANQVKAALGDSVPPMILNGEFVAGAIQSGTVRKGLKERATQICREGIFCVDDACKVTAQKELTFVAYDVFTATSLQTGVFKLAYGHVDSSEFCRSTVLSGIAKKIRKTETPVSFDVVPQVLCQNSEDLHEAHRAHKAQGFAGSIIKPCSAHVRFEVSDCLFKWKESRQVVGYILCVYALRDTIGLELFVPDQGVTQHVNIPTKALKEWFWEHMNKLCGYAVEFTETPKETGSPVRWRVLSKLLPEKEPLSHVQAKALTERFGVQSEELRPVERMSLKQFSSAAALLTESNTNA